MEETKSDYADCFWGAEKLIKHNDKQQLGLLWKPNCNVFAATLNTERKRIMDTDWQYSPSGHMWYCRKKRSFFHNVQYKHENLHLGWLKNFDGICATTLKSIGRHPGLDGPGTKCYCVSRRLNSFGKKVSFLKSCNAPHVQMAMELNHKILTTQCCLHWKCIFPFFHRNFIENIHLLKDE